MRRSPGSYLRDLWKRLRPRAVTHRDYTRFVILGNPRTGSNMLRGLLNETNRIVAFGELFRFNDAVGWDRPGYAPKAKSDVTLINADPRRFLEERVFTEFPTSIGAVGFKIFYFHARQGNWTSVWDYLHEQRDIKIIHIKRRNVLKTFLSHTRALQTDKWLKAVDRPEEQPPIALEYDQCLHYFEQIKTNEKEHDECFKDHPKIELIYEDLAAAYKEELKRVTDFLEVPGKEVKPITFPQAVRPLSETITNYRELKERFRSTPWENHFED